MIDIDASIDRGAEKRSKVQKYIGFAQCSTAEIDAPRVSGTEPIFVAAPHIFTLRAKLDFSTPVCSISIAIRQIARTFIISTSSSPCVVHNSHSIVTSFPVPDPSETYLNQHLCPRISLPSPLQPSVSLCYDLSLSVVSSLSPLSSHILLPLL